MPTCCVHVVDATAPDVAGNIEAVHTVLREIDAGAVPQLLAFNKADLDPDAAETWSGATRARWPSRPAPARASTTCSTRSSTRLRAMQPVVELSIPYDRGDVLAAVHREGEVLVETHGDRGTIVQARLDPASRGQFVDFEVEAVG